jgi:hypothetical protein
MVVEITAFVALTGPLLVMTSQVIKLTQAFWGLAASIKGIALAGKGTVAAIGAMAIGEAASNKYMFGGGFATDVGNWAAKKSGYTPKSSSFSGSTSLIPGVPEVTNEGGIPPPVKQLLDGWKDVTKETTKATEAAQYYFDVARTQAQYYTTKPLSPFRADPTAGIAGIQPGSSSFSGGTTIGNPDFMMPDADNGLSNSFDDVARSASIMRESVGAAIGSMISNLEAGGKSFGQFALEATKAIMQVVQAELIGMAMSAIFDGTKKGGIPGMIAGIVAATAAIAVVNSLLSGIEAPKLARGGVSQGATMAMIGDNASGKEMVLPFERNTEFARDIARQLGSTGGGGSVEFRIRGNDLYAILKNKDQTNQRIGNQNFGFAGKTGTGGDG